MDRIFKVYTPESFAESFSTTDSCLKFLSELKWRKGYECRKCGNSNYCTGKKPYSRRCTRCKHEESVTSHTVFHNTRLPITDAFRILFSICCNPQITAYKISKDECIRNMTCWKLRKKIMDWMEKNDTIVESV